MANKHARLAEILIHHGMLDDEQLASAIESQLIYGGRMGTNLVELGFVPLDDVARCLVIQSGVPQAMPDELAAIDQKALSLLPTESCGRHHILPLRRERDVLHLAMRDYSPSILASLCKELACDIKPYVVPELRFLYYLEQHCGIERPQRFLRVPDGGEGKSKRRRYLKPIIEVSDDDILSIDTLPGHAGTSQRRTSLGVAPVAPAAVDAYEESLPTSHALPALKRPSAPPPIPSDVHPVATAEMRSVLDRLSSADTGAMIAQVLVAPLNPQTVTSVLFWVRGSLAMACYARGTKIAFEQLQKLVIPLDARSTLRLAVEGRQVVRARAEDDPLHLWIATYLATPIPDEVCVAPVVLRDQVVNLICLHAAPGKTFPSGVTEDLRGVANASATAYARLRQRMRGAS